MPEKIIPLWTPDFGGKEIEYTMDAIDRNEVASGAYIIRFEQLIAEYTGRRYAVAVSSGTAALHLALSAVMDIKSFDFRQIITSDLTFIAPANAISYIGGKATLMAPDPTSWQLSPAVVEECLDMQRSEVVGIVPVHILGNKCNMKKIMALADKHGIPVVEDCAQSFLACGPTDEGPFGVAQCYSFNGNKSVSCGGGGAITTDDAALSLRLRHLRNQANTGEYRHDEIGYNYRMSNVHAAIGCAQMERIEDIAQRRLDIYDEYLRCGVKLQPFVGWMSIYYDERFEARELRDWLNMDLVETRLLWEPMHMSRVYRGHAWGGNTAAERIYRHALCLPSGPGISDDDMRHVAAKLLQRVNQLTTK